MERLLVDTYQGGRKMATRNAAPSAGVPVQITVAGMAADLYGSADERPPLVLLHGLTFDRRIWRPVLVHLARLDPGRQILSLDLPGTGNHQVSCRIRRSTSSG
jgi:pimeloyl-ACP methyl ester carboxylesterase